MEDVDVKRAVLFVLGENKEGVHFSELIIKGLENKNSVVFRAVCDTARNLRYSPVAKLIAEGLKSKSIATIESSLRGLEYAWGDEFTQYGVSILKASLRSEVSECKEVTVSNSCNRNPPLRAAD